MQILILKILLEGATRSARIEKVVNFCDDCAEGLKRRKKGLRS